MTQMASFSVRDIFTRNPDFNTTYTYSAGFIEEWGMSVEDMVHSITLLNGTARTNVILRDASGRFISYKKVVPEEIGAAVASLKPFPTI